MTFSEDIKILIVLLFNVIFLAIGHLINSKILILAILLFFILRIIQLPRNYFLAIMLFYLPWSPVLKLYPDQFTWFTIAVPLFFLNSIIFKKKSELEIKINIINLIITIAIAVLTLFMKLYFSINISFSYIMFLFMLIFIPSYLVTYKNRLSFKICILFLSIGIISACIISSMLMKYPHMLQYIDVYEWSDKGLVRLSGFYGDSNFYAAQIIIAICGNMLILIKEKKNNYLGYIIIITILLFFGMKSVSKMFIILTTLIVVTWIIKIISSKVNTTFKFKLILILIFASIFIYTSGIFTDLFKMYLTRFSMVDSLNSLTTGRSNIILDYIDYFSNNLVGTLFGVGITSTYINGIKGSAHNTIFQIVYQFGLIGSFLIIIWVINLINLSTIKNKSLNIYNTLDRIMMIVACFAPWLSLDILFFDEFFYVISLYVVYKNYAST